MGLRGMFEGWHIVVLLIVVLVVFGSRRLPDAARGLGKSLRIFKSEMNELRSDDSRRDSAADKGAKDTTSPEPLEGRIVDGESARRTSQSSTEPRRDA